MAALLLPLLLSLQKLPVLTCGLLQTEFAVTILTRKRRYGIEKEGRPLSRTLPRIKAIPSVEGERGYSIREANIHYLA